jgi:biopolymer transport protein ExbD
MRACVVVLVVGSACSGEPPNSATTTTAVPPDPGATDCKLVLDDPARARERLSARYPRDAVQVAQTIERCIAPTGDECERYAKIVHAIPAMMGSAFEPPDSSKTLDICRHWMTPEMRRCGFPSYSVAHQAECAQLVERMRNATISEIPITPRAPATAVSQTAPPDDGPVLGVEPNQMTLTTGPHDHRVVSRHTGTFDFMWLETQLTTCHARLPDRADLTINSAPGVRYKDVIHAMDVALKVGLSDVGLDSGDPTPADDRGRVQQTPRRGGPDALNDAPVLVVTKGELTFEGKRVATVAEVRSGTGVIAPLAHALAPAKSPQWILQADESTDMNVITRAIFTFKRAGYDSVMFAVKR